MKTLVKIRNLTLALAIYFTTAAAAQTQAPGAVPVRGKTVDTDGHPLSGVVIQQYGYEWTAGAPGLEVRQQVTTDRNGEFQMQVSRVPTSAQAPVILVARRAQL